MSATDTDALPFISRDILVSYEFNETNRSSMSTPETALMIAVLDCAVRDATRRTTQSSQLRRSAMAWLFSDDMSHLFSYRAVCDVLDIDPGRTRRRVTEVNPRDRSAANQTSTLDPPAQRVDLPAIPREIEEPAEQRTLRPRRRVAAPAKNHHGKGRIECMSTSDHIDWLREQLSGYEEALHWAQQEQQRLQPIVETLQATVSVLAAAPAPTNGNAAHRQPNPVGLRTLERKPEYDCSLADAIARILDEKEASCTDLVQAIFADAVDIRRARKSVTSAVAEGMKKKRWRSLGNGRYAARQAGAGS